MNDDQSRGKSEETGDSSVVPAELDQMTLAFQRSRIFLTAIELDVFTAVGDGSTAEDVAERIGASGRGTEMLLNALTALELLHKDGGRFRTTEVTERFFSARGTHDVREAMHYRNIQWHRWSRLTDAVRAGTAVEFEEIADRGKDWVEAFIASMQRGGTARAGNLVEALGADRVGRLLDIGGGPGAYSIAFARANESLHAEIFDLPNVVPIARRHIEEAGLSDRVTTRSGDLRTDSFGDGWDLILLSSICHLFGPAHNESLVRRCHAALAPGGRLAIQETILSADKTSPASAAIFSLNMLGATKEGAAYSESEYRGWLEAAGFADVQRTALPPRDLMVATKE